MGVSPEICHYKVLLVDDSESIRNATLNLLKRSKEIFSNYQAVEGTDGIDALNFIMHDQIEGGRIKIIISDENMEFMNGSETFRIIRKLEQNRKVKKVFLVSLTAFSDDYTLDSIKKEGADLILSKPLTKSSLTLIHKEYLAFKSKNNLS